MTSKREFLAQHPLFHELYDEELDDLVAITEEREYAEGGVIAYQRDLADSLYIVRTGHLLALAVNQIGEIVTQDKRHYMAGQFFGDTWLFAPEVHPATVKAVRPSRVLIIKGDDFRKFEEKHKIPIEYLGFTDLAQDEARRSRLFLKERQYTPLQLQPDELVEWQSRRTPYILLLEAIVPFFLSIVIPALLLYLFAAFVPTASFTLRAIVAAIPALIGLAIMAFYYLDWSNDHFLITNRYLVHSEFSLRTFTTSVDKVPIEQVQSVEVEKPNFVMNMLNVGSARITTAAQNRVLRFDYIDDPQKVKDTLNQMQRRGQALNFGREQAAMRESVEGYFALPPSFKKVEEPKLAGEDENKPVKPWWQQAWQVIREEARRIFSLRLEEGNIITYRKHPIVLLATWRWPLIATLFLFLFNWAANLFNIEARWLWLFEGPVFILILFWMLWQFLDWDNDLFQVSDRYVMDIDRLPFGFGESRKQAELGNIQNVSAVRPSLLATIFNFGNVQIETAGAAANIVFENVYNPNRVQNEIFVRRDAFQRKQALNARNQQRREYSILLDVYKQALEQGRIPTRTPSGDLQQFLDDLPEDEPSLFNEYNQSS